MKIEAIRTAIERLDDSDKFNYGIKEQAYKELAYLEGACRWPHDHEKWREEGIGCCVCSNVLRGLTGEELAKAAQSINWRVVELERQASKLKSKNKRLSKENKRLRRGEK